MMRKTFTGALVEADMRRRNVLTSGAVLLSVPLTGSG